MDGLMTRNGLVRAALVLLAAPLAHAADIIVPTDFATIQQAIDAANSGDVVIAEPGTYIESISLRTNIDVRGGEAARTFIEPPVAETAVTIDTVADLLFANFTIIGADIGIDVIGGSNIQIASVVLDSVSNIGVRVDSTSTVDIVNNAFWSNANAVLRSTIDAQITNNIFEANTVTIAGPALPVIDPDTNVAFNCFFDNADLKISGVDGSRGTSALTSPSSAPA